MYPNKFAGIMLWGDRLSPFVMWCGYFSMTSIYLVGKIFSILPYQWYGIDSNVKAKCNLFDLYKWCAKIAWQSMRQNQWMEWIWLYFIGIHWIGSVCVFGFHFHLNAIKRERRRAFDLVSTRRSSICRHTDVFFPFKFWSLSSGDVL